ncbi:hypothetical protein J7T55_010660 [Diaporthe amygdali]|uniref:uncharacterized protein n=1 Tax=Phomopsis amygdali TaxID=1214568 RepID=UPI0022FEB053|nr:uncharacterized protein J7T55_010660 [Diaporthe amygdali]KAJ0114271.1 hypothetical protein J7T55_010660 [Diaporthe amygdali]
MATTKQTFVYKTATVPIELDVYLPSTPPSDGKELPLLVWFHGGGLLQGNRDGVAPHHLNGVTKHGYALISADYRLSPQVSVKEVLDDVKDCLDWTATELPKKLADSGNSTLLDTTRIAVSGSSAGGYLALLAGLYATGPGKPKVVLPIYPITNPLGTFFTTPQPHPAGHVDKATLEPYLDPKAPVQARTLWENDPRASFYFYMLQEANLAQLLHIEQGDDTFIIAPQIRKKGSFYPTFIVHGDADRFVGVEQSDEVVDVLREVGAVVEYERPKGLDHIFDLNEDVKLEGYYAFLKKHL